MGVFPILLLITFILSRSIINVFALLIPLTALFLVCAGISLFVSALYVFFRDLPYFYELFNFLLWISSPVFYPSEIVPENVKKILFLNPLLPIINSVRQISLSGNFPDITLMLTSLLSGIIVLTVGAIAFISWQNKFMDLL